jgi:hypothetical protein
MKTTKLILSKMVAQAETPVHYWLEQGETRVDLNALLGKTVRLAFSGEIYCAGCGKKIKKTYNEGFCFDCFQTDPRADESVVKPALSMAQFGEARDMEWAQQHDLIDHYVYLSITNAMKVGVTRHTQIPTRWIDQGAVQALVLAQTPNRHIAGIIESALMAHVADKTNWQPMLKGEITYSNLVEEKQRLAQLLHPELRQYVTEHQQITEISYPQLVVPLKISSATFDKTALVEGQLIGIKGQYLYFEGGTVLNIRRHTGYAIEISISE